MATSLVSNEDSEIDETSEGLSKTSTAGQTEYRAVNLEVNNFEFLDYVDFLNSMDLSDRRQELQNLIDVTGSNSSIDIACLSEDTKARLGALADHFSTRPLGYHDVEVVDQAVKLRERLRTLSNANEDDWTATIREEVWNFFSLFQTFSYSTGTILWYKTDPAIIQLIPERSSLKRAKPDFAVGLKYPPRSPIRGRILMWPQAVIPSVNLRVTATLSIPFFIFESKTDNGSLRRAENQLANSMLRAHDILCSLGLSRSLFILGAIQYQFTLKLYASFSLSTVDEDGKAHCQSVHMIKYKTCELDDVNGCLNFLQFVQYTKSYGLTTFKDRVEAAIMSVLP